MKTAISTLTFFLTALLSATLGHAQTADPMPIEASMRMPYFEQGTSGKVELIIAVNRYGEVATINTLSTTDKDLLKNCKQAVEKWQFIPAQNGGSSTLGLYEHTFYIENGRVVDAPAQETVAEKTAKTVTERKVVAAPKIAPPKPKVVKQEMPQLDSSLSNVNGFVKVHFGVSPLGKVDSVSITDYSHHELIAPTLSAAENWRFDDAPANAKAVIREYDVTLNLSGADAGKRSKWRLFDSYDSKPEPVRTHIPTFDIEAFSEGERFSATLTIDEHGYVADVSQVSNANEAQAQEISKAFYSWKFKPAMKDGSPVMTRDINQFIVKNNSIQAVRPELDQQPRIISSQLPTLRSYQSDLEGYVLVSMSIDKDGNVYDARVVESTNDKLDKPSIEASYLWKFLPGMEQNAPKESTMVVPFVYPINS